MCLKLLLTLCSVGVDVQEIARSALSTDGVLVGAAGGGLGSAGTTTCTVSTLSSERGNVRVALLFTQLALCVGRVVARFHYPFPFSTAEARKTANVAWYCAVGKFTRQTTGLTSTVWL